MPSQKKRIIDQNHPFIIALSMVKNEEDIIEPFIRHNLEYVDIFCVLDNGSFDNTRTILEKMQEEGLPIIVIDDPEKGYKQREKMTRFCQHIMFTLFPDYVLFLDADEFIKCNGKGEFIREIKKIPSGGKAFIEWQSYIVNVKNSEKKESDTEFKMERRKKNEESPFSKVVFRPDGNYYREIGITQGNHDLEGVEGLVHLNKIKIAHFPVRSAKQLKEKCISGWMAYLMKSPRARYEKLGFQWLNIFDKVKNGIDIDDDFIFEFSANYTSTKDKNWAENVIDDPLQLNFSKLKYNERNTLSSLSKTARLIEDMLAEKEDAFLEYFNGIISEKRQRINAETSNDSVEAQIFQDNWHHKNLFFDIPPFEYLSRKYQPETVLDVGCGIGQYLTFFKFHGTKHIMGIDGISPIASLLDPEEYLSMDLSNSFALNKKYDLVVCLETVEHLDYDAAIRVIRNISDHAIGQILFSAAEPGQPGLGHINCQPIEFWIEKWAGLGWEVNEFDTISFRMLSTFAWFKRNILVLNKVENKVSNSNALLKKISHKEFAWWNQSPKIVQFPLQEDLDLSYSTAKKSSDNSSIPKYTNMQLSIDLSDLKETENITQLKLSAKKFEFYAINEDPIIILPKINYENLKATALRIEIIVPEKTILQIFYKLLKYNIDYSEENSLHMPLETGENDKYIELPNESLFEQLRIDPGINCGYYVIKNIEFWQ